MNRQDTKSPVANIQANSGQPSSFRGLKYYLSGIGHLFASSRRAIAKKNLSLLPVPKSSQPIPFRKAKLQVVNQGKKSASSWWMLVYFLVITIGLSTILGTGISVVNSWQGSPAKTPPRAVATQNKAKLDNLLSIASFGREIAPLKAELQKLQSQYADLEPRLFLVDLDTKGFVNLQGQEVIASASTIKLPILVAFLQEIDRGGISLNEQLVMTPELIAKEAGDLQHRPPGSKVAALEVAEKMIIISDNTATNMLIERLGGNESLNRQFKKMGLAQTQLHNLLPDLSGTNLTTAEDLANLLVKIDQGKLLSLRSRDRLLQIMRRVKKDILLPQGLESGALIAHKTGELKSVLADVGMIDMPNGKRYIAAMLVQRPDNAAKAQKFIQQASQTVYQYFKQPRTEVLPPQE